MKLEYDIISSKHFFELINKPEELTIEETKRIQAFTEHANSSIKYKDYLLDDQRKHLDTYERGMESLAIAEDENPNVSLNSKQKYAIEQYRKNKQYFNELGTEKVRVLKNNDVSSGYTNSFILILSVLATGILLGLLLFSFMK